MLLLDCLRDMNIPTHFESKQQEEFLMRDLKRWGPFDFIDPKVPITVEAEISSEKISTGNGDVNFEDDL